MKYFLPFILVLGLNGCSTKPSYEQVSPERFSTHRDVSVLDELTEQLRMDIGLPGLGIGVIQQREITGIGCSGSNRYKELTHSSEYVIASCSKSITATLAARLVSEGYIEWKTTLSDLFPEFSSNMDERYRKVTLSQLLHHVGGTPGNSQFWGSKELKDATRSIRSARTQRKILLNLITQNEPLYIPGSKYVYSNAGYYMAAAMLEKAMDESWENLIKEKIFSPLEMTSSTPTSDIDPILTMPAGGIKCTLNDFSKFCIFHLKYDTDNILNIKREDYDKLHQSINSSGYGMGFIVVERNWAGGSAYTHVGRNRKYTTVFWLAPEIEFGLIAVTPVSDGSSAEDLDRVIGELINIYMSSNNEFCRTVGSSFLR